MKKIFFNSLKWILICFTWLVCFLIIALIVTLVLAIIYRLEAGKLAIVNQCASAFLSSGSSTFITYQVYRKIFDSESIDNYYKGLFIFLACNYLSGFVISSNNYEFYQNAIAAICMIMPIYISKKYSYLQN